MGVNPDDGWTANYEIIPDKEKVIKDLRKASKEVEKVYLGNVKVVWTNGDNVEVAPRENAQAPPQPQAVQQVDADDA